MSISFPQFRTINGRIQKRFSRYSNHMTLMRDISKNGSKTQEVPLGHVCQENLKWHQHWLEHNVTNEKLYLQKHFSGAGKRMTLKTEEKGMTSATNSATWQYFRLTILFSFLKLSPLKRFAFESCFIRWTDSKKSEACRTDLSVDRFANDKSWKKFLFSEKKNTAMSIETGDVC